jgi:branched-chain amino acid aminotransferase
VIHRHLLHNDRICDSTELLLRPGQLGLLAGWGVFSTIRVIDGVLFEFPRHWNRMKRDAELLRIPFPAAPAEMEAGLHRLIEANQAPNATLRVVVVRNTGGLWEGPNDRPFDLIALTASGKGWPPAVRLGVVPQARHAGNIFAGTKVTAWGHNLAWAEEAQAAGFDEVVLLNERDEVAECTSANIFAIYGQTVRTPPLTSGCLPGITRNVLLEEIHIPGISIEEGVLRLEDLERADQVLITSTTRCLLPVSHIEGLTLETRGDVCARLQQSFNQYVQQYVAARTAVNQ